MKLPNDFHYNEAVTLIEAHGFVQVKTGKTGGSRVRFKNGDTPITLHKPHPSGILKKYQLKDIIKALDL